MHTLVLLRHGESTWNQSGLFTGWTDVDLTEQGVREAQEAGVRLRGQGVDFDIVHTSLLTRAIRTANLALEQLDRLWLPVRRSWRVNERHYGALQGLSKEETAKLESPEQVHLWRRSYRVRPPALTSDDKRHPRHDPRYQHLPTELLPATECLADVVARFLPYWYDVVVPDLQSNRRVLIVAHGNSLRALVKHLERISDEEIPDLNIPTGIPLRYTLGESLEVLDRGYLT